MANPEHLKILKQGVEAWNKWREENPEIEPDLSEAILADINLFGVNFSRTNLNGAYLRKTDLSGANLCCAYLAGAVLRNAYLGKADLREADLREANLFGIYLCGADLTKANLKGADLREANLRKVNFNEADLSETKLEMANLVETRLTGTNISYSKVYGISVWNLKISRETKQLNLVITKNGEPAITVDNLEVAQFVYLLLNNEKIRDVIDTIGEKGVLILGRFTEQRKVVLNAIRDKLRELGFVPMMFDFEKPTQRDFTETIKTLAGLSRFIIADITNPKSSPLELQATMPDYMIPFVPIIQEDEEPFSMFQDLQQKYGDWVLDVLKYDSAENLLKVLDKALVKPALKKADELLIKKAERLRDRHVKDYM